MLKSQRVRSLRSVLANLKSNPFLKKEEAEELKKLSSPAVVPSPPAPAAAPVAASPVAPAAPSEVQEFAVIPEGAAADGSEGGADDETVSAYIKEHDHDIAAEGEKPFHAVGGIVELLGSDYFPVTQSADAPAPDPTPAPTPAVAAQPAPARIPVPAKRDNALQKINRLDVKGRIQLALKGNKEERSLLIRDGTKVVALAVLEAPKLSDGEVEKFASQKNVLESVLRQIPLKRRFMKNYKVVRNLVANPRTPLDLGLGLMKHLLAADLKNIGGNKDVSETVRKLALKMYKQKEDQANKK
jgi:hypothetical protein